MANTLQKKKMVLTRDYRGFRFTFLLWKAWFDKGLSITSYFKYIIAFFGLASQDVKTTLIIAIAYAFACFILGWAWYKYKFVELENEINNLFNPFVKEMREKI